MPLGEQEASPMSRNGGAGEIHPGSTHRVRAAMTGESMHDWRQTDEVRRPGGQTARRERSRVSPITSVKTDSLLRRRTTAGVLHRRFFHRPAGVSGRRHVHDLLEGAGRIPLLVVTDALAAGIAVAAAVTVTGDSAELWRSRPWLATFPLLLIAVLHLRGLYRGKMQMGVLGSVGSLGGAISVAAMLFLGPEVLLAGDSSSAPALAWIWAFSLVTVILARTVVALVSRAARVRRVVGKPTLVVGAGVVGDRIAQRLEEKPEFGLRPVGFLDADPVPHADSFDGRHPVLGAPEDVVEVAARTGAEHIIFAFTRSPDHGLIPLARRCEELGLEVSLVPRFFESMNDRVQLERVGTLPLFALRAVDPKGWQFTIKYAIDRVLGLLLLLLAAPLMLAVALAVKVSSPGPILFRQRRVGRDGQHFDLLKFRSMREDAGSEPFKVPAGMAPGGVEGEDRRTPIGKFLRRSALDELPQLINVVKGEMSLVGPRPERPEFVETFRHDVARYTDRHRVKSGITGWAQVNGLRGQTPLRDRIESDNFYIENWSLWFDVRIMLMTAGALLRTGDDA